MSDARKRIYLFFTVFRACSTPFKECRVGFYKIKDIYWKLVPCSVTFSNQKTLSVV